MLSTYLMCVSLNFSKGLKLSNAYIVKCDQMSIYIYNKYTDDDPWWPMCCACDIQNKAHI